MNVTYTFWAIGVAAVGIIVAVSLFAIVYFGKSEKISNLTPTNVAPSPVPTAVADVNNSQASTASTPRDDEYRDIPSALAAQIAPEQLILYEEEITDDLGELTTLKQLVIRSTTLVTLPPSIGKLQRLEILNVANTPKLSSLPPEVGKLVSLEQLNIANTAITTLPSEIKDLRRLRVIFASVGQFSDAEKNNIKQVLPSVNILER